MLICCQINRPYVPAQVYSPHVIGYVELDEISEILNKETLDEECFLFVLKSKHQIKEIATQEVLEEILNDLEQYSFESRMFDSVRVDHRVAILYRLVDEDYWLEIAIEKSTNSLVYYKKTVDRVTIEEYVKK